jgi:hypothetical protein
MAAEAAEAEVYAARVRAARAIVREPRGSSALKDVVLDEVSAHRVCRAVALFAHGELEDRDPADPDSMNRVWIALARVIRLRDILFAQDPFQGFGVEPVVCEGASSHPPPGT